MKVRTGFVSNSSSSSFIVVGTSDMGLLRLAFEKMTGVIDLEDQNGPYYSSYEHKGLVFIAGYDCDEDGRPNDLRAVGLPLKEKHEGVFDIDRLVKELPVLRKKFCELFEKVTGEKVDPKSVKVLQGESGNG